MKMLFAFILISTCITCAVVFNKSSDIFLLDGIYKACIVTTKNISADEKIESLGQNYIYGSSEEIKELYDKISSKGVILYFNDKTLQDISKSLNMQAFWSERVDNLNIIYGYTPMFNGFINNNGKRQNVQLVEDKNGVIAGFPIILSGY